MKSVVAKCCAAALLLWSATWLLEAAAQAAPPLAPVQVTAKDHPWDQGHAIDVSVRIPNGNPAGTVYLVQRCGEPDGLFETMATVSGADADPATGLLSVVSPKHVTGRPYWFRAMAVSPAGESSVPTSLPADAPAQASRQYFDGGRLGLLVVTLLICGAILLFTGLARWGLPLKVRKIAGLEAIEEAVGRATEMGRSCLFVPGIQDMNEMQTIAGLTILSRVAERAAEYDCQLETPTSKSLVMTAARETVSNAFLMAGRPDAYREDLIYYVTDEQFAYVSFLTGKMVREKPAACFYLGSFFAESLILAETGNAIGAIQVAGTAQPAQLPFFVAACDYTLIGEEFFAASAYLSNDADQLGSLKGQDFGKFLVSVLIIVGVTLVTLSELTGNPTLKAVSTLLTDQWLQGGG